MNIRFKQQFVTIIVTTSLMAFAFVVGTFTGYVARPVLAAEEPSEFAIFWKHGI